MRRAAVETLGSLAPDVLAMHGVAIAARLEDTQGMRMCSHADPRQARARGARDVAAALVAKLEDSSDDYRKVAMETLGKLAPEGLRRRRGLPRRCSRPLIRMCAWRRWRCRKARARGSRGGHLPSSPSSRTLIRMRKAAVNTLGKLAPGTSRSTPPPRRQARGLYKDVRKAAAGRSASSRRGPHDPTAALVAKLEDTDEVCMRRWSARTLAPDALAMQSRSPPGSRTHRLMCALRR